MARVNQGDVTGVEEIIELYIDSDKTGIPEIGKKMMAVARKIFDSKAPAANNSSAGAVLTDSDKEEIRDKLGVASSSCCFYDFAEYLGERMMKHQSRIDKLIDAFESGNDEVCLLYTSPSPRDS